MQMMAVVPTIRAASATPCAWFPDEYATTPRARSVAVSNRSLFSAPRILNEPARWRFSHLKKTWQPLASSNAAEEMTGVRWMRPASRWAAARTSSIVSRESAVTSRRLSQSGQARINPRGILAACARP